MCLCSPRSLRQPTQENASDFLSVLQMERLLEGGDGLEGMEEQKQRLKCECRGHGLQLLSGLHSGSQL